MKQFELYFTEKERTKKKEKTNFYSIKKVIHLFFLFISLSCFAQLSKTHYIPPLTAQSNIAGDHYLYISTPSSTDVNYRIIPIGGIEITGVVKNNTPIRYNIGSGDNTQLFTPKSSIGVVNNKGYIVEGDDLIYVSVRVNAGININNNSYSHAGGLVSKGNSALGKTFRLGAMLNPLYDNSLLNFGSILSTENNTKVTISNIQNGTIFTDGSTYTGPITIILNKNESYVLALENQNYTNSNSSKIIGALVETDKPVVVNSGSFAGSNSTILNGQGNPSGRDVGFDQIVSYEKTGKEYIFVKGLGTDELERVLLVAHIAQTAIYLNGSSTPFVTLNPGDYFAIDGSQFINGNLYVKTSENVFAYQSIAGTNTPANQNMFFVPPLNCATLNTVDNIPSIQEIGNTTFSGGLNIVTEKDALVKINGINTTATQVQISGNSDFVRYTINNLTGNIAIKSTKQVYVSYFGTNGAATYGGYYSGFNLKPEIVSNKIAITNSSCIPNIVLNISSLSSYDSFQWYFNGVAIDPILHPNAITNSYTPDIPGYYQVRGSISGCPTSGFVFSDTIPVSNCPTNIDNDFCNDNVDIDNDNDGVLNCIESLGNLPIDISNSSAGNIALSPYSNSFTGVIIPLGTGTPLGTFTGSADGSFISEVPAGKANKEINKEASSVTYKMEFSKPISLGIEYVNSANLSDLLNSNAEYILNSDVDKTITVLNPDNQLLIDINYDGIYDPNIKEYSSNEIRFQLKSTTPLAAGTGTFKFLSYLTKTIQFTHKNLSDTLPNKSTLKFFAVCLPKDSDGDLIPDQLDLDSDNDGIPDIIEAHGNSTVSLSNSDTDNNGLDNAFSLGFTPVDTDNDGVPDYLDLDSDNDGILDLIETGIDTDVDGIKNYRDLDSDKDLCSDVIEAGFLDSNGDGLLGGIAPPSVNSDGQVTSGTGYTTPSPNYLISAPIVITVEPNVAPTCNLQNALITLTDNGGNTYQWQLSTDNGGSWTNITDNATYFGATTNTLSITSVTNAMNGYKYRVQLSKNGNSCGLISAVTTLTVYALPNVTPVEIIQCDDDLDLKTDFNLSVKNDFISSNSANENFTYYTSLVGANTANLAELISTPQAFQNINPPLPATQGLMYVWARVSNKITGCFSTAKLTLKVAASKIPLAYSYDVTPVCDDTFAKDGTLTGDPKTNKRDGISSFYLTDAIKDVESQLPPPLSNYTIKYYRNKAAALAQNDSAGNSLAIKPTEYTNFRNDIPLAQNIWVRVNNNLTSDCGDGFGDFIKLKVEELPFANAVPIFRQCDDDQDGIFIFNTAALESTLLGTNQSLPVTVTYLDALNNPLKDSNGVLIGNTFPLTFSTKSQTIKAVVTNNTTLKCYDETLITFIVDDLPEAFPIPVSLTTTCDDEPDPLDQDGKYAFDTSTFEATVLGLQTGMKVKYYDGSGNTLRSPLPNPFVTGTQNIKVVVENPSNTTCTASIIIPFLVQPLPRINLNIDGRDDKLVCQNNPLFIVTLNAGIQAPSLSSDYDYIWLNGIDPKGSAYTLDVNAEGLYTVEVINRTTGCSRTRTIKVTASDKALIKSIDIVDLTDINTVTVNVTGIGSYEYSLDEPSGFWQDSNFFENVPAGIHDVYINDKNGCGAIMETIAVVGAPKFFTPNNDGYNDYWDIKGVNATFNSNSTIYIFDRYGKLLKQWIPSSNQSWDGTINGAPLPADDYWFTLKLEDGREAKGHFSLKR